MLKPLSQSNIRVCHVAVADLWEVRKYNSRACLLNLPECQKSTRRSCSSMMDGLRRRSLVITFRFKSFPKKVDLYRDWHGLVALLRPETLRHRPQTQYTRNPCSYAGWYFVYCVDNVWTPRTFCGVAGSKYPYNHVLDRFPVKQRNATQTVSSALVRTVERFSFSPLGASVTCVSFHPWQPSLG